MYIDPTSCRSRIMEMWSKSKQKKNYDFFRKGSTQMSYTCPVFDPYNSNCRPFEGKSFNGRWLLVLSCCSFGPATTGGQPNMFFFALLITVLLFLEVRSRHLDKPVFIRIREQPTQVQCRWMQQKYPPHCHPSKANLGWMSQGGGVLLINQPGSLLSKQCWGSLEFQ